jgi:uncharacterized protein DUF3830
LKRITITLKHSGVSGTAVLIEDKAPRTCAAIWQDLPIEGPVFHAKWANNELYTIAPPLTAEEPGRENPTVFPIPGDLIYWYIPTSDFVPPGSHDRHKELGSIDLALFYGRDNYLLGPAGHMPGNLWGMVEEGLPDLAAACLRLWREGFAHERMLLDRA